jgi:hypothetical protein
VKFASDDCKKLLLSFGLSEGAANDYVEMFSTLDKGLLFEDYVGNKPRLARTSIEESAKKFAGHYRKA